MFASLSVSSKSMSSQSPARGILQRLGDRLRMAEETRRQRRSLLALDAHLLADIGLTADAAQTEAQRADWDVPAHWRQS